MLSSFSSITLTKSRIESQGDENTEMRIRVVRTGHMLRVIKERSLSQRQTRELIHVPHKHEVTSKSHGCNSHQGIHTVGLKEETGIYIYNPKIITRQ